MISAGDGHLSQSSDLPLCDNGSSTVRVAGSSHATHRGHASFDVGRGSCWDRRTACGNQCFNRCFHASASMLKGNCATFAQFKLLLFHDLRNQMVKNGSILGDAPVRHFCENEPNFVFAIMDVLGPHFRRQARCQFLGDGLQSSSDTVEHLLDCGVRVLP